MDVTKSVAFILSAGAAAIIVATKIAGLFAAVVVTLP